MLSWFFRGEFCSSDGSKVVTTQPDTSFREEIPCQKREREQLNERTVTCVVDCHVTVLYVMLPQRAYLLYGVKVYSVASSLDLSVSPSHTVQLPTTINVTDVSTWPHAARHKLCLSFQPTHPVPASCVVVVYRKWYQSN